MARLTLIFSIVFSLFLLSHARLITSNQNNEDSFPFQTQPDLSNGDSLPVAFGRQEDGRVAIRLPSDKSVDAEPSVDDMNVVSLNPVDRPFPRHVDRHFPHHTHVMMKKRPFGFRFPRPCRGHEGRPIPREISYGRDMVGMAERHHQIPAGMWFPAEMRQNPEVEKGFPGELRSDPMRPERFHGHGVHWKEAEEMSFGEGTIEAEGRRDPEREMGFAGHVRHMPARWMEYGGHMRNGPERHVGLRKEGEHKEREEGRFMKPEHKEREEGGFMKPFEEFLNRF